MSSTDQIANLLTVIRNANNHPDASKHRVVKVFHSNKLKAIANILKEEKYIENFRVSNNGEFKNKPRLELLLKANRTKIGLTRISKSRLRVYVQAKKIPYVLNGLGMAIISTSEGMMTDKEARKRNLGGEVIAYVYRR